MIDGTKTFPGFRAWMMERFGTYKAERERSRGEKRRNRGAAGR